MADDAPKFLDPATLARLKDLELQSRQIVDGFVAGRHRSPLRGNSVEFAEHREYTVGDDTRHIDWKVFGKTERYYLKLFEQETDLICNLVLDTSESMAYASAAISKHYYGCLMAATLARLVMYQQDSAGLTLFEDRIRYHVAASSQASRLQQMVHLLAVCQPANLRSQTGAVLDDLAGRLKKRSVVMLISDLFVDDWDALLRGLKHLRHRRHEVVVFQVLDPAEIDFPFDDVTLFEGLEEYAPVLVDPQGVRTAYRETFGNFLRTAEISCRAAGIEFNRVRTDQPLGDYLARYLANRQG